MNPIRLPTYIESGRGQINKTPKLEREHEIVLIETSKVMSVAEPEESEVYEGNESLNRTENQCLSGGETEAFDQDREKSKPVSPLTMSWYVLREGHLRK